MKNTILALVAIIAMLCVTSCHKDEEQEPKQANEKTLFVYMPWSTNLTSYFRTNIADIEKAILKKGLKNERVIVFFSTSEDKAAMYEIVQDEGGCKHIPLKEYQSPRFTSEEGLTEILRDMKSFAPAENFSMIIGCHGMGWLPVSSIHTSRKAPAFRPHFDYTDGPLTRFFGGLSAEFQTDISTLKASLLSSGLHMQFILFDDCYMSSIEVAYELREVTDVMIACPTEIMAFGMPYETIGPHLLGTPDYKAVCDGFYKFYSNYSYPYGTLGVTNCNELDALAEIVREINLRYGDNEVNPADIQRMDGYSPVIFFDFQDYIEKLCPAPNLLGAFIWQLEKTIPYHTHTTRFYSATRGVIDIETFCGITTSAPSHNSIAADWTKTSWYLATH